MIDTLHAGIPPGHNYTPSFARWLKKQEGNKEVVNPYGRDYSNVIDLRYYDIPALLHVVNVRDRKADDKFEFIGAGKLKVPRMMEHIQEVYRVNAWDCSVMRMDTASDLHGSYVPWCRDHVRVKFKQAVDAWHPGKGSTRDISKALSETIYWGIGSFQLKVYDKTGERIALLKKKRRRMTRAEREALSLEDHFQQEHGYSMFEPRTRFERRFGARQSGKVLGIERFAHLERSPFVDPFTNMQFPEQAMERFTGKLPRGLDEFAVRYLRDLVKRDGLTNARNEMKRAWSTSAFYRNYNAILPLILPDASAGPRREDVRGNWVASVTAQLAA